MATGIIPGVNIQTPAAVIGERVIRHASRAAAYRTSIRDFYVDGKYSFVLCASRDSYSHKKVSVVKVAIHRRLDRQADRL